MSSPNLDATHHDTTHHDEFVFNGTIVDRDDEHVSVQIVPGFVVDVRTDDIDVLEEEADPVSQRSYVHIRLNPDADIAVNFRPRLARIAAESDQVPFVLGGAPRPGEPVTGMPGGGATAIPPLFDQFGAGVFGGDLASADGAAAVGGALPVLGFFQTTNTTTLDSSFTTLSQTANPWGFRTPGPEGFIADTGRTVIDRTTDEAKADSLPDTGLFR